MDTTIRRELHRLYRPQYLSVRKPDARSASAHINLDEPITELSTQEMYDRMSLDSSCIRDLTELDDEQDAVGASLKKMCVRIQHKAEMSDQDEAYRRFLQNLWQVESFVAQVISSDKPGFKLTATRFGAPVPKIELALGSYFSTVYDLATKLELGYKYSPRVDLFANAWKTLRLGEVAFNDPNGFTFVKGKRQFELFNDLLDLIRTEAQTEQFKRRVSRAEEKFSNRCHRSKSLVDALFVHRSSRLLVLRLEFGYRRDVATAISAVKAKADLRRFLNNVRECSRLYRGWLSHIRKLEYTPQKGMYFHLVVFFDGAHRADEVYLAQKLGEYWVKTTEKRGCYWNCNNSKNAYRRRGIGMIEKDDHQKRQILQGDIAYLAKTDQQLRSSKLGSDMDDKDGKDCHKLFVTSQIPRKG